MEKNLINGKELIIPDMQSLILLQFRGGATPRVRAQAIFYWNYTKLLQTMHSNFRAGIASLLCGIPTESI